MSKHKKYSTEEITVALTLGYAVVDEEAELYEADEGCQHVIKSASGGGVECMRCGGWHCH